MNHLEDGRSQLVPTRTGASMSRIVVKVMTQKRVSKNEVPSYRRQVVGLIF